MTQKWMDEAFVLGLGRFREVDMWVRLITRQKGMLSVFAFGGARSRRRFAGCLDLFNELTISVTLSKRGQYAILQEAVLREGTQRLRKDPQRLGVMLNCTKFLDSMGIGPDSGEAAFLLLQAARRHLEEAETLDSLWPLYFRMRLASDVGYALHLHVCGVCGQPIHADKVSFHLREAFAICGNCHVDGISLLITRRVIDALMLLQYAGPAVWGYAPLTLQHEQDPLWYNAVLNTNALVSELEPFEKRLCAQLIDGFVQYHLGIVWERGRFIRR